MNNKQHLALIPVDPAGTKNRRWKCEYCGQTSDNISDLMDNYTCSGPTEDDGSRLLRALSGVRLNGSLIEED